MTMSRLPAWTYPVIAGIPVLVLVGADFVFFYSRGFDSVARLGLILPALVWALAFTAVGWTRLDEPGREAHKFAWFYGGGLALMAGMIAVILVPVLPAAGSMVDDAIASWAAKWPVGHGGFVLGVLFAAVMQVVGWAIVWSTWWLVRRR